MLPDLPDYEQNYGLGINDDGVAVGYAVADFNISIFGASASATCPGSGTGIHNRTPFSPHRAPRRAAHILLVLTRSSRSWVSFPVGLRSVAGSVSSKNVAENEKRTPKTYKITAKIRSSLRRTLWGIRPDRHQQERHHCRVVYRCQL